MPSKSGKGGRSSKTARVLSLLTDPASTGTERVGEEESTAGQSPARSDDRATQEQIRDALVEELFGHKSSSGNSRKSGSRRNRTSRSASRDQTPPEDIPVSPDSDMSVKPFTPPVVHAEDFPPQDTESLSTQNFPSQDTASLSAQDTPSTLNNTAQSAPLSYGAAGDIAPAPSDPVPDIPAPRMDETFAQSAPQNTPSAPVPDVSTPPSYTPDAASSSYTPDASQNPSPKPPVDIAPGQPDVSAATAGQFPAQSDASMGQFPAQSDVSEERKAALQENPDEFICYNLTQALVEDKADKYMKLFGMCTCQRCKVDVTAIALSNLPSKYVATQNREVIPMLSMYEGQHSAEVITEVMNACKKVMSRPHHGR